MFKVAKSNIIRRSRNTPSLQALMCILRKLSLNSSQFTEVQVKVKCYQVTTH